MMKFSRFMAAAAAAGAFCLFVTSAQALPTFSKGSFAFNMFISTTGELVDGSGNPVTTHLALSSPIFTGATTDDFSIVGPPAILSSPAAIDFVTGAGFDFSDPAFGSFVPTFDTLVGSTLAPDASYTFDVEGTFIVGSAWANAGFDSPALETWVCNQTEGTGQAISCSGTFFADVNGVNCLPNGECAVPEPLTLSLMGAGLLGTVALRRRRRKVGTAA